MGSIARILASFHLGVVRASERYVGDEGDNCIVWVGGVAICQVDGRRGISTLRCVHHEIGIGIVEEHEGMKGLECVQNNSSHEL